MLAFYYTMIIVIMGLIGILCASRNIIILFIEIELILLATNFNFIAVSLCLDDAIGFIWAMSIFVLAGVEAALSLSILIVYYRLRGIINTSFLLALKG